MDRQYSSNEGHEATAQAFQEIAMSVGPKSSARKDRKPRKLILLDEAFDARDRRSMSSALGDRYSFSKAASSALTSAGAIAMADDAGGEMVVFPDLGVAAGDFSASELKALASKGIIDETHVFENETRSLPPLVIEDSPYGAASTAATALALPIDLSTQLQMNYLRGMRDAIDMVLGQIGGRAPSLSAAPVTAPQVATYSWCLEMIGVHPHTATGNNVTVAILDTGVDPGHPDLMHHFVGGRGMESFVRGVRPLDGHGHGTHCAGVVAGTMSPQAGPRYGVAPGVTLLIGKVLDDDGNGDDDQIMAGIQWAVAQGADVISMSLGSRRPLGGRYSTPYEGLARVLAKKGILLIAAAGNDSRRPNDIAPINNPGACPSFKAVAALDRWSNIAPFSCGEDDIAKVAISAPGMGVHSAWTGGGYKLLSGTSMATPHVAGAAALWVQRLGKKPHLWEALSKATRKLTPTSDFGAGLIRVPN
ncbi:MAG TPA: S8 family serine peptidase [Kofleriaceae bacterium]|nr:S8 family serine peptidase [Kofleriaceae bacterium]